MKIFILEDDGNCEGVIKWLQNSADQVKCVKNLEDVCYYLEYEEEYKNYDKFFMDASVPAASVLHLDGTQADYNGRYNGIDYIIDCFKQLGINMGKVAILTAFSLQVRGYLNIQYPGFMITIIDKNDENLTKQLQDFLYA